MSLALTEIKFRLFIYVHGNSVRSYCRNTIQAGSTSGLHFTDDLAQARLNNRLQRSNSVYTGNLERTEAEDKYREDSDVPTGT
jgi:hypothetical protein